MRVVLDTNVLVAALLKKGKAYRLVQYGLKGNRLGIAVAGKAEYLVTGDKDHLLSLGKVGKTRIISLSAFLKQISPYGR